MLNSEATSHPNPYIGPRAFRTGEKLYGRNREARQLLDLLIAERVVLLHSPSGAGKSSLIRAGLIPLLEEECFRVLPTVRVNLDIPPNVPRPGRVNRYLFSFMLSCEEVLPEDQRLPLERLAAISTDLGMLKRRARRTFDLLAGLGGGSLERGAGSPREDKAGQQRIGSLNDYLTQRLQIKPDEDCVLIFDQLEETLTLNPHDQEVKAAFFAQLGTILRNRKLWALFAMREDYMAGLTPYLRFIPSRLANTFRLDLLGAEAAQEALQQPACQAGVDFTDEAARKLVDDLRRVQVQNSDGVIEEQLGQTVEPVQLQVVGYRLWASLAPDNKTISIDNMGSIGNVDQSLADYYAEHAAAVAKETGARERVIREWFEHKLITEQEIRRQVLLGAEQSEGLDNGAVRRLENAHLIRAENRGGATWFELVHDRLIRPIKADNAAWFQANLSLLQRQAALWHTQNHPEGLLLRDQALTEAEAWASAHVEEVTPTERNFLETCRKARAAVERERRWNYAVRLLALVATLAALAAIVFGTLSAIATQNVTAEVNKRATAVVVAEQQRQFAEQQRQIAVTAQAQAQAQQAQAEQQRQIAVTAQAQAVFEESKAKAASSDAVAQAGMRATSEAAVRQTLSQLYASQARDALDKDINLALLLGVEAYNVSESPEATRVLSDAMQLNRSRTVQPYGRQPPQQPHAIYSLTFSPDGKTLAWGSNDNTIAFWNMDEQEVEKRLKASTQALITPTLAYNPGGTILASGGDTGAITLWNPANYKIIASLHQIVTPIYSLAFSPNGDTLAAGTVKGAIVLWRVADRSLDRILLGREGDIFSIAWSRDGRLAAGSGGSARVWNSATGETVAKLSGLQTDMVGSVVWSPDGKWLASGAHDGTIAIWDASTGQAIGAPLRHAEGAVFSLAISPDGHTLASGGNDHTVILWDVTTLNNIRQIAQITTYSSTVTSLAFSAQDMILASGSHDGSVYLNRLSVEEIPDQPLPLLACTLAKRNLTQAEWTNYFPGKTYRKTCEQWPAGQ